jgi:ubiquinone/menaquinone biosynthesis C-methylase UbiE
MAPNSLEKDTSATIIDSFASSADTYERRIGRATRTIAAHIASKTLGGIPLDPTVHDNACGTGAFTDELLKVYPHAHVDATDAAAPMVEIVNARMRSERLENQVKGSVMDGAELKFEDTRFDASVTNFGIFFLPEPVKGMKEIYRTLKPGAVAVLTCWENLDLVWVLFTGIETVVQPKKQFTRPDFLLKWKDRATMEESLKAAGFADVEMENVKALLWGHDVDDLAGCLSENMKGFVGEDYAAEEKERCFEAAKTFLGGEGKHLVTRENGKVGFKMSAWVAKAVK